jgi:DNA repair exonuclease SbcCD ATPase subunit
VAYIKFHLENEVNILAKKANTNSSSPIPDVDEQKKRKKEAKREARMMLEIEEAKTSIQKAEKKLAKAQANLEARNTHLRTLEADLSKLRTSHEEIEVSAPDTGFDHQAGQPELEEITISSYQQDTVSSNEGS